MRLVRRVTILVALAAMMLSLFLTAGLAQAADARTLPWAVSVTYQNVGTANTPVTVTFFAEGSSTAITYDPLNGGQLAAGAGKSFFIGSVTAVSQGFRGNAVMSAQQPLVATVVQFVPNPPAGETVKMRLLSNGFQSSDASNQYLIATVLKNKFSRTTVFSIQNTETFDIDVTVKFYDADNNGVLASTKTFKIVANSSEYLDMASATDTGINAAVFNGSAIVTAVKTGATSTPANVVAAASEYYNNKNVGANFEGVPLSQASTSIYMATALCQRFGLDTFYAVQNASLTTSTQIKVTYRDTNGVVKTSDGPFTLGPGGKRSITTCTPSTGAAMANFSGSAVIESTGVGTGAAQPLAVIGKAQSSIAAPSPSVGLDVFTAFLGQPAGVSKLALPFVRWAKDSEFNAANNFGGKQRSFIAVQNLGSSQIKVNVKYFDKNGAQTASQQLTINGFAKQNSDPKTAAGSSDPNFQFGYYNDGTFGGAVTIEADPSTPSAKFIAVVRVQNPGAGEDYNGLIAP